MYHLNWLSGILNKFNTPLVMLFSKIFSENSNSPKTWKSPGWDKYFKYRKLWVIRFQPDITTAFNIKYGAVNLFQVLFILNNALSSPPPLLHSRKIIILFYLCKCVKSYIFLIFIYYYQIVPPPEEVSSLST